MRVFRSEVTDSTNIDARAGHPGDVFVAEFQRAGRGRLDHKWHAARGENLTFSAVLPAAGRAPSEIATIPLVVGLAVAKAVERLLSGASHPGVALKWPNDVLVGGRKIAGVLCERNGDCVIAGVGLNVNQTSFPDDIAERATSLALLSGGVFDREAALDAAISSIEACHSRWMNAGFASLLGEISELDCLRGREVAVRQTDCDDAPVAGICGGIAPDGSLVVGGRRVFAGEAHVES